MPTVQFAEVPNTSSISNKCCLYAIMVILRIGLTGGVVVGLLQSDGLDLSLLRFLSKESRKGSQKN